MILGFTGTQSGMNSFQIEESNKSLNLFKPKELHHGDCIGSDSQFHYAFLRWHIANDTEERRVIIHPPSNPAKRAYCDNYGLYSAGLLESLRNCKYKVIIEVLDPLAYLIRNQDIVRACDVLIATPKEIDHTLRSGTWATIRYGWHQKKQVVVIPPIVVSMRKS